MAWRSVSITHPAHLSVSSGRLKIAQEETHFLPLDDLNAIILSHPQISLTAPLLGRLADHNIAVFSTDERHLPNGVFHSFQGHSRQTKAIKEQIGWSLPFKKRIQQKIIINKIRNQGEVLNYLYPETRPGEELFNLIKDVDSGDRRNRESQAAGQYFRFLFHAFNRRMDNLHNAALNYGYSLVRGFTARAVVAHGFIPCLGLFHDSELNSFNLADDLMEPYRPLVDERIFQLLGRDTRKVSDSELSPELKKSIAEIIFTPCRLRGEELQLHHSLDVLARSLSSASRHNDYKRFLEVELILSS